MKYHYFYQDRDNRDLDGWIEAADRTDAYAKLRQRKIRPYKVLGRNPLAWKRWTAIAVLAVLLVAVLVALIGADRRAARLSREAEAARFAQGERTQIYGDPSVLQRLSADGWRRTFPDAGDAWLARHAIPGRACDCRSMLSHANVISLSLLEIRPDDEPELVRMKQIVNGMKAELRAYLQGGGSQRDYMLLCDERLQKEIRFARRAEVQFTTLAGRHRSLAKDKFAAEWEAINESLRALGLPTVVMPGE